MRFSWTDRHAKPAVRVDDRSGEAQFALRLRWLYPDRRFDAEAIEQDAVSLLLSISGHRDSRVTLQFVSRSDTGTGMGVLDVALLVSLEPADDAEEVVDRAKELSGDLLDALSAPPRRWELDEVVDADELEELLGPVEPAHLAELCRREEPLSHRATDVAWPASPVPIAS